MASVTGSSLGWCSRIALDAHVTDDALRVTQEPHKHIHYASLLVALSRRPAVARSDETDAQVGEKRKAEGDDDVDPTRDILNDLNRAFRNWVEGREWLNMRLAVSLTFARDNESELTSVAPVLLSSVPRRAGNRYFPARAVQVALDCPRGGRRRRRSGGACRPSGRRGPHEGETGRRTG